MKEVRSGKAFKRMIIAWLSVFVVCIIITAIFVLKLYGLANIIYDTKAGQIIAKPTFWQICQARANYPNYFVMEIPHDVEIVDIISNAGFRAKFKFVGNKTLIESYLKNKENPEIELKQAINQCLNYLIRQDFKIEKQPSITMRAFSISNMNEQCPLNYLGFSWQGNLEIAQCHGNLPLDDNVQKNDCLNSVRFAHY